MGGAAVSALRLTVVVGEDDRVAHRPLYTEIVHRAHRAGLAGATVLRGVEGYGRSARIHTDRLLSLSAELPMFVVIVDAAEKVRAFLPELAELGVDGLVTVEPVELVDLGDLP
ncbi:UPF0166 protein [Catellatospora sp. TT07R-123]|nr:UPF0166 protein [Catellatospora sp. TT07R-123]